MDAPKLGTRGESPAAHVLLLALLLVAGALYATDGSTYTVVGLGLLALFVLVDLYYSWYRGGGVSRVARDALTEWERLDE